MSLLLIGLNSVTELRILLEIAIPTPKCEVFFRILLLALLFKSRELPKAIVFSTVILVSWNAKI